MSFLVFSFETKQRHENKQSNKNAIKVVTFCLEFPAQSSAERKNLWCLVSYFPPFLRQHQDTFFCFCSCLTSYSHTSYGTFPPATIHIEIFHLLLPPTLNYLNLALKPLTERAVKSRSIELFVNWCKESTEFNPKAFELMYTWTENNLIHCELRDNSTEFNYFTMNETPSNFASLKL